VLRVASVVGRNFLYRLLHALDEANQQLDQQLNELQQIDLVREKQRTPELEFMFKHALAQEVTYESILLQKRRELHALVGRAIETLFADRLAEFYGVLAYHYARAEVWDKAQMYLLQAGDQAGRMAADAEALAYYEQAAAAYVRAFGDRWDPVQRASLHRKMGEAFFRRGDHERAFEHLERALADLGHPLPKSRRATARAVAREVIRQISHRLVPGLTLRHTMAPASERDVEEALIYNALAWIDANTNTERLIFNALWTLNLSERVGYTYGIAYGSSGIGFMLDALAAFGLAKHYHGRGVALADQMQHLGAIGLSRTVLTMHYLSLGEWNQALDNGLRATEAFRQAGDLHGRGTASEIVAQWYGYRSEFERGLAYANDVVRLGQDSGDPQLIGFGLQELGFITRRLGRLDEAAGHLQQAIQVSDAIPDYLTRVRVGSELGRCYLDQDQPQAALSALTQAQRICAAHNLRSFAITPLRNGLAEAHLRMAEESRAPERAQWLAQAGNTCQAALKQGKVFRGGVPEAYRLKGIHEWLRGRKDAARGWWQRSLADAEVQGLKYDAAMAHLEIGRRLHDHQHLSSAQAIFAEIGVQRGSP
jgi:tetratricopeptide (TPR) repeat protein